MMDKIATAIDVSYSTHEAVRPTAEPTTPIEEAYVMPATQGQNRFWSLDQLHPGNPALNMPLMWQCRGPLNFEWMAAAFTKAMQRHEILRTTFAMVDDKLSQIIGPSSEVTLPVLDLQHLPDAARSPEAGRLIREHAAIHMDLRNGPLLSVKLLKFSPQHHLLLVTMHHIICDGISLGILLRDMAALYEAEAERKMAVLPELPIQFADFSIWQEEWRKSAAAAESLDFWRRSIGREPTSSQLRRDPSLVAEPGDTVDSATGDIETLLVSPELTKAAHEFCVREGVTLNILFFSVFCALISRVSGQLDLVIGSPCANRSEETEELIGLFMNIQVMRLRLAPDESFHSLLLKVQDWTLAAYDNQMLPFEELVYDSFFAEAENALEIPIFFLYQKSFMITHRVAGLEIVPLRSMSPGAVFEMMFAIVDRAEEGPRLQLEYNPQHYRATTIQRFLDLFVDLLASGVKAPSSRLGKLEVRRTLLFPSALAHDATASGSHKRAQAEIPAANVSVIPKDPIEAQLLNLWRATLRIDQIDVDTDLFSLGASSLTILRLVTRMNKLYSMHFGLASVISAPNIRLLAVLVRRRYAPNTASSLVPIQPVGDKPSLYIVHGAGGNVVNFYGLSTRIGSDQPVYGVQAQALEAGQPALLKIEDMAAHYLKEIRRIQPKGPYHFLGYSFGGIVVLEMAHQLRAAGQEVGLVGMLDTRARDYLSMGLPVGEDDPTRRPGRFRTLRNRFLDHHGSKAWFETLREDLRVRRVRYMTTVAAKFSSTMPAAFKDTHEINSVAARNYRLKPYAGTLSLFRAAQQADDSVTHDNGWAPFFTGGVEIHEIPGDHWHVLFEPGIDVLAEDLRDCLSRLNKPLL
jgi:thioesterase domain-containing protein